MKRVTDENFSISLRFVKELHGELMRGARTTHHSYPGEFRTSSNWIGGTNLNNARFVPPVVDDMKRGLDGNGRTGRMFTTFYLWKVGLLEKPVLL